MSAQNARRGVRWPATGAGVLLVAAVFVLQSAVVTRLIGMCHVKTAERQGAGAPELSRHLERARQVDPSNGRASWLLSKECLRQALQHRARAQEAGAEAKRAREAGNSQQERFLALREAQEADKSKGLFESAERLARDGTKSFNTVESFMQLASIYFRQDRSAEAEPYLQLVARIKPDDVEALERLGLIKLHLEKWDELEALCEQILRKHPYSANAYYYKAFIAAKKGVDRGEYYLNLRQAYLMMIQQTGTIFFPRRNLEEIVLKFGLAREPEPQAGAPPGRVSP